MRIDFNVSQTEAAQFATACEAAIRNVNQGSKAAVTEAGLSIMSDSFDQVPVDTGALIRSAYLGVSRRTDVKNYRYGAILGYGDIRGLAQEMSFGPVEWLYEPTNNINSKTGLPASAYAAIVHEDLDMPHPNGGKAKFLEDPIRNWAAGKFARTAMTYWQRAITYSNSQYREGWYSKHDITGKTVKGYRNGNWSHYRALRWDVGKSKVRTSAFVQQRTSFQRGGSVVHKGTNL